MSRFSDDLLFRLQTSLAMFDLKFTDYSMTFNGVRKVTVFDIFMFNPTFTSGRCYL